MTNHFYAIDPQGVAHTRSSKGRTYTHTVLTYTPPVTFEDQCREVGYMVCNNSDGYWKNMQRRAVTGVLDHLPDFDVERRVQEARDFIAANPSLELYMARMGANALASFEAQVERGHYDRWINQGWCGRPDLAQKLAAKMNSKTMILEAIVGKPPKAPKMKEAA